MAGKLDNFLAKARDGLGLGGPGRVFYHLGRPNFGDDLNPWILGQLSGATFRWGSTSGAHVLGVGSIGARATGDSWVMGSGLLRPLGAGDRPKVGRVLALRGALTAEMLRVEAPYLGDPVCLIDRLLPRPSGGGGGLGVVPHAINVAAWRRALRAREDARVIDPAGGPLAVVRAIAACDRVASQSLHGLVVADAYGIPAVWMEPSEGMVGGRFKFDDYFTAFHAAREPVGLEALVRGEAGLPWEVAGDRGDKAAYLGALREGLREFLARRPE